MEATLFKQVGYSLSKLIEDVDIGEIGLPDIQRPFVWTPAKVRDLFDSMYKGGGVYHNINIAATYLNSNIKRKKLIGLKLPRCKQRGMRSLFRFNALRR